MLAYLTTVACDGMIDNMEANLVLKRKLTFENGSILEMVIWKVPSPIAGSLHNYKYRLFFGVDGIRLVGFDNERGKGDHVHFKGSERPYQFSTVKKLVEDFYAEIERSTLK